MGKILKSSEFKETLDLKTKVELEERGTVVEAMSSSPIVSKERLKTQSEVKSIYEEAKSEAAQIRKEAKEVLSQVQAEMEKSRKLGYDQGYKDGMEKVLEYLGKIHLFREKMFKDVEPQIVKLSYEIAEKVLNQQLKENDSFILEVTKHALDSVMGAKMVIRVNPQDLQNLKEKEATLLRDVDSTRTVSYREDESIKPGGCIVETELGVIDAQLATQLTALKKTLGLTEVGG